MVTVLASKEDCRPVGKVTILALDPKEITNIEDFFDKIVDPRKKGLSADFLLELKREKSILDFVEMRNLIVNVGKNQIAQLVTGYNSAFFNFIGVGSGTTTPAATDTDLTGPYIGTRVQVSAGYYIATGEAKWDAFFGPAANQGCYSSDTECLTQDGWKFIADVAIGENVLSLNSQRDIVWEANLKTHAYDFDGEMISFKRNCRYDLLVTPNHWMAIKNKSAGKIHGTSHRRSHPVGSHFSFDGFYPVEAQYLEIGSWLAPKTGRWQGLLSEISIDAAESRYRAYNKLALTVNTSLFAEFLAWYFSEGSLDSVNKITYDRVTITQYDETAQSEIVGLCEKLNLNPRVCGKDVRIGSFQIARYLAQFGVGTFQKRIPKFLKEMPVDILRRFLITYAKGDGHIRQAFPMVIFTSSEGLRDDLQEIGIKAGYAVDYGIQPPSDWSKHTKYWLRFSDSWDMEIVGHGVKPQRLAYKGKVYCLEVPSHVFLVRRNGSTAFCGNTWYEAGLFNNGTTGLGQMAAHTLVNPTSGFVKGATTAVLDWQINF